MAIGYEVKGNPYLVSIEMKNKEQRMVIFKDGRALVHGTKDLIAAKTLCDLNPWVIGEMNSS